MLSWLLLMLGWATPFCVFAEHHKLEARQEAHAESTVRVSELLEAAAHSGLRLLFSDAVVGQATVLGEFEQLSARALDPQQLSAILRNAGLDLRAVQTSDEGSAVRSWVVVRADLFRVHVRASGQPLQARVEVFSVAGRSGLETQFTTDIHGIALLDSPQSGTSLRVIRSGYRPLTVRLGKRLMRAGEVTVQLDALPESEELIVVRDRFVPSAALDVVPEDVAARPGVVADPIESAAGVSGLRGVPFKSLPEVRGTSRDGLTVSVDGFELVRPFHLGEFGAPISILPAGAVARTALRTTADVYVADHNGGVLDLVTDRRDRQPAARTVQVGPLLAAVSAGGPGRGFVDRWFASGRNGLLNQVADAADVSERPRFWDGYADFGLNISESLSIAVHALTAADELELSKGSLRSTLPSVSTYRSRTRATYGWVSLQQVLGSRAVFDSVAGWGRRDEVREAGDDSDLRHFDLTDTTDLSIGQVRQTGRWFSDAWQIEAGAEYRFLKQHRRSAAQFELPEAWAGLRSAPISGSFLVAHRGKTERVSAFAAYGFRLSEKIALSLGARYEEGSRDRSESALTPRVTATVALPGSGSLTLGYARTAQSQQPQDLQISDGELEFSRPELGHDWSLSWRQTAGEAQFGATLFHRSVGNPRLRYFNLLDPFSLAPELEADRRSVLPHESRSWGGVLRWGAPISTSWRVSVEAGITQHRWRIEDYETSAPSERPIDTQVSASWRPPGAWSVDLQWTWGSGLPTTPLVDDGASSIGFGRFFSERLPAQHQLGVRVARAWTSRFGGFILSLDVENLYHRRSVRGFRFTVPQGTETERQLGTGVVPAINLRWTF